MGALGVAPRDDCINESPQLRRNELALQVDDREPRFGAHLSRQYSFAVKVKAPSTAILRPRFSGQ
jgi:hypothetical protein